MPFTDLEARVNASVMKHLANTQAFLDGVAIPGLFKNAYSEMAVGMGMAGTVPTFRTQTASVPASPVGKLLQLPDATYAIAAHEPDGTGLSVLILECAA